MTCSWLAQKGLAWGPLVFLLYSQGLDQSPAEGKCAVHIHLTGCLVVSEYFPAAALKGVNVGVGPLCAHAACGMGGS